jgi:hypothetical protein
MYTPQPTRTPVQARTPKAKPDAWPMRLALGGGGIALLSALAAVIVLPPKATAPSGIDPQQQAADPRATSIQVQRAIRYVQLSPGQTAPPGAKVIDAAAPTPLTVIVTITAPPQQARKPTIIRTTQSGKVVP